MIIGKIMDVNKKCGLYAFLLVWNLLLGNFVVVAGYILAGMVGAVLCALPFALVLTLLTKDFVRKEGLFYDYKGRH